MRNTDISVHCGFLHGLYANIAAVSERRIQPVAAILYFNAVPLGRYPISSKKLQGGLCFPQAPQSIQKALQAFPPIAFEQLSYFVFETLCNLIAKGKLRVADLLAFEDDAIPSLCRAIALRRRPSTLNSQLLTSLIKAIQSETREKDGTLTHEGRRLNYSTLISFLSTTNTSRDILLWQDKGKSIPLAYAHLVDEEGTQHLEVLATFSHAGKELDATARGKEAQEKAIKYILKKGGSAIPTLLAYREFARNGLLGAEASGKDTVTLDEAVSLLLTRLDALREATKCQGALISCF